MGQGPSTHRGQSALASSPPTTQCAIPCSEVDFLGYRTQGGSYYLMHSNVQGILEYAYLQTVKAWQRFHGMVNFYRLHVSRLSDIMKPVTDLFSKKGKINQTPDVPKLYEGPPIGAMSAGDSR